MKTFVKNGRKVIGWVEEKVAPYEGQPFYFAFGKPSQPGGFIAFDCSTKEEGINKIKEYGLR